MSSSIMQLSLRQGSYYDFSSKNVNTVFVSIVIMNMATLLTGLNTALTKKVVPFTNLIRIKNNGKNVV